MNIAALALLWLSSMAWHLARIAIFRPDYRHLSDSAGTAISFTFVFALAGWLRWDVLGDMATAQVLVGLLVWWMVIMIACERSNRSSALAAAMLGASAVIDLMASAANVAGLGQTISSAFWLTLEILMMVGAWRTFTAMPADVQAAGYGRKLKAEEVT